jgi:hypothetical protein
LISQEVYLKQPSEHITLLFSGKALKEYFKLSRLRTGNKPISVYVKDTGDILLRSAKAMT